MKKQLQKKHKVMIGVGSGILGAAAIATPLALTLTQNQSVKAYNLDEVYGVNKSTYTKMKKDIYNVYAAKLEAEGVGQEEASARLKELHTSFQHLDSQVSKIVRGRSTSNIYTAATTTLMKIAKHDYGIDAVRTSRANWNEVEDMFESMKQSFATYMDNHLFGPKKIAEVIKDATERKEAMMAKLKVEYANDKLGGVLKAKNQLFSLFDSVNTEIAKLAGTMRLAEFMANYTFTFREDAKSWQGVTDTNANRFEVLTAEGGALQMDKEILEADMNKIFVCYNQETRQEIPFSSSEMIPGYTITPVYKGAVIDAEKNEYQIKIDWTIVSENVADKDKAAATAHLLTVDKDTINNLQHADNIKSFTDAFDVVNKIQLINYVVLPSSSYAASQLEKTYFNKAANGTNIEFTWDEALGAKPCYDGFMYAKQDSTETQYISLRQLAQTGIVIKCGSDVRLLKDVINLVDQDNYEPKDMIEKFVKYCDVVDGVTISKNGIITNDLKAAYSNAKTWKATRFQDGNGVYTLSGTPAASTDWDVSDDFFYQMNNSYNTAYKHAHLFIDKGYQKIKDKADIATSVSCLTLALNWTITVVVGGEMIASGFKQDWPEFGARLGMFVLQAGMTAGSTYYHHMYKTKYLTPVRDYKRRADQFEDSGAYSTVNKKLNSDQHWFILFDSQHPVSKESKEYKEKRRIFNENFKDKAALEDIFKTYTYFEVDFAKEFFSKAYELQINPEKFRTDFSNWRGTGDCIVTAMVFDVLNIMALSSLELMTQTTPEEAMREEMEEDVESQEAAREGAEVASEEAIDTSKDYINEIGELCTKIDD